MLKQGSPHSHTFLLFIFQEMTFQADFAFCFSFLQTKAKMSLESAWGAWPDLLSLSNKLEVNLIKSYAVTLSLLNMSRDPSDLVYDQFGVWVSWFYGIVERS